MNITFRASAYLFVLLLTACAAPVAPPPVETGPSARADFSLIKTLSFSTWAGRRSAMQL